MAAHVDTSVIDNGLASLKSAARYVHITSSETTNYATTTTASLGNKDLTAGGVFPAAIADGTNGRKLDTATITDGTVTADGTASNWAITSTNVLLAVGALASTQSVTNGNQFSLATFSITIKNQ